MTKKLGGSAQFKRRIDTRIRAVGTCELAIPKDRYDAFALLHATRDMRLADG